MSEELATISDTEGSGAGVVFGFVLGGIVATLGLATAAGIKGYGAWKERRRAKNEQDVIVLEEEKPNQKKN